MRNFSAITTFYGRLMAARRGEDGGVHCTGRLPCTLHRAVCLAKVVADSEVNRPWYVDNVDNVNNVEHMGLRMDMNSTVCKKL